MKRWNLAILLSVFMALMGGCAFVDALFGVNEKGEPQPGIVSTVVNGAVNSVFPGSGAVLGGLGALWAAFRARKWKAAMVATAEVVEKFGDLPKVELKEKLSAAHAHAGVGNMVQKIVTKFDEDPEPPKDPTA